MKLKVGKSYITRDGSTVTIRHNTNEMGFVNSPQPFGGALKSKSGDRAAFFTEDGKYSLYHSEHRFDIVEEKHL